MTRMCKWILAALFCAALMAAWRWLRLRRCPWLPCQPLRRRAARRTPASTALPTERPLATEAPAETPQAEPAPPPAGIPVRDGSAHAGV